jgi:hypothetical protein
MAKKIGSDLKQGFSHTADCQLPPKGRMKRDGLKKYYRTNKPWNLKILMIVLWENAP